LKRRTAFLIANITIVLLSLLTGLKVMPGPDFAGIALAFYSIIVLPGIIISNTLFGGAKADFEGITRIFLSGISSACVFVLIGFMPGVGYAFIAVAYSSIIIMALAYHGLVPARKEEEKGIDLVGSFSRREDYSAREKKAMIVVFILLFGICAVLLAGNGETGVNTDAPDHISFIRRSLETGEILPGDSFHREGDGTTFDPRKGLWHPVLSLWAWMSDAQPHVLWSMLPAFLAFFAVVVFWFFAGELSGSIPVKALSILFLVLFFRGDGTAWLTKLSYSRNISQIVFWGASGFLIRYLRSQRTSDLAMAAISSFAGTAVHLSFAPVFGTFMFALMLYVSIPGMGGLWQGRFWRSVPLVTAAVALPLAVRLINFPGDPNMIHTHMQGMMEVGAGLRMLDPAELIAGMGLPFIFAFLLIPFYPVISSGYKRSKLVWLLFSVPAVLVLNPLTGTLLDKAAGYMHFRLLYAAPAMVYLAIAIFGAGRGALTGSWKAGEKGPGWKRSAAVRLAGLAVFLIFAAFFLRPYARIFPDRAARAFGGGRSGHALYGENVAGFLSGLPEGSVIAADPVTGYTVSAFTDHFVTVTLDQHCSPADTSAVDRVRRSRDIFSPASPDSAVLHSLLEDGAEYVFLDTGPVRAGDFFGVNSQEPAAHTALRFESYSFLKEIGAEGRMRLYEVDPGARDTIAAERAWTVKDPCIDTIGTAAGELVLHAFDLDSKTYLHMGRLRAGICWSVPRPLEFGLPLQLTLRFDTDFEKGSFYRTWYGKQYRRRVERRRGELYRYTISGRIAAGGLHPDMWETGEALRQMVEVRIPPGLAPGEYTVGLTVSRRAYLPNRHIRDYFLNEDSFAGQRVGTVRIGR
jgi:hypothetical protein